jgi:hypothetical protein
MGLAGTFYLNGKSRKIVIAATADLTVKRLFVCTPDLLPSPVLPNRFPTRMGGWALLKKKSKRFETDMDQGYF